MLFIPTILIALKLVVVFIGVNNISKKVPENNMYNMNVLQKGGIPNISDLNDKLVTSTQVTDKLVTPVQDFNENRPPLVDKGQLMNSLNIKQNDLMDPLGVGGSGLSPF